MDYGDSAPHSVQARLVHPMTQDRIECSVTLVPATAADASQLLIWRNRPHVARWMYTDHLITADEHARWIATAFTDPTRRYWIVQLDGAPVGLCGLTDISQETASAAISHYIAEPAAQGKGVGAAIEIWLLDRAFQTLDLATLRAEVFADNQPACALHEAFGFTRRALLPAHVRKSGVPHDVAVYALSAAEWMRSRPAALARLQARGVSLS